MTIIIPYTGNAPGLSQLLIALQPQLSQDDDIYIIDTTPDCSGLKLAKLYGTTRSYIFVETAQVDEKTALVYGLQNMRENRQDGAILITPYCVIPVTFIANMRKAAAMTEYGEIYPQHIEALDDMMPADFSVYGTNRPQVVGVRTREELRGLTTQCRYIRNAPEPHFKGLLVNETIVTTPLPSKTP